ncbi:hypothetical protein C5F59_027515 [Streptomyces sp. QL37]|uniref:hypothetical protein n=1 Tax=Streptomyces sp. QL37 TaxID=2093747 RepID=UPI000CF207D8|nr:hypothetical protein [Streptomyces sp. QL37]PPQ57135.1 hypothetical protein C5F59_10910 [Streptomyces sp. QL37]
MAQDDNPMERLRNGKGRFDRSIHTVERDAAAAELRAEGRTFQQIADELGYSGKGEAFRGVQRAKADVAREPVAKLIQREAEQLDELYVAALEVLERDHVMVSHGKIVKDDQGVPLLDDGPKLAAVRELRAVRESYRKLFGTDAPSRVSVDAQQLGAEISALFDRVDGDDSPST